MNTSDNELPVVVSFDHRNIVLPPEKALELMRLLGSCNTKVLTDRYVKNETSGKYETHYALHPASMKNLCAVKFLSAAE